jgi:hypothetical protein
MGWEPSICDLHSEGDLSPNLPVKLTDFRQKNTDDLLSITENMLKIGLKVPRASLKPSFKPSLQHYPKNRMYRAGFEPAASALRTRRTGRFFSYNAKKYSGRLDPVFSVIELLSFC